jgi:hypothetical protein
MPNLPTKTSLSNLVAHPLLAGGLEYPDRLSRMKTTMKNRRKKKKRMVEILVCTCLASLFDSNMNRHHG